MDYSLYTNLINKQLETKYQKQFIESILTVDKNVYESQSESNTRKYKLSTNQFNIILNMVDQNGLKQFEHNQL